MIMRKMTASSPNVPPAHFRVNRVVWDFGSVFTVKQAIRGVHLGLFKMVTDILYYKMSS